MYRVFKYWVSALAVIFLVACGGGGGGSTPPPADNNDTPAPTAQLGSVAGVVTDTSTGDKLAGVAVKVMVGDEMKTATTDTNGIYKIDSIPVKKSVVVSLTKSGYVNGSAVVEVVKDFVSYSTLSMKPYEKTQTLSGSTGGSVAALSGAKVTLGSDSLVDTNGNSYTGTVTVNLTYLDPTSWTDQNTFPGNFEGVKSGGEVVAIKSYGYIDLSLFDGNGNKLQLASNKTAEIEIPVPSSLQSGAPSTMPLWYYNETSGTWEEKGTLALNGSNYVGTIPHFSIWNADYPYDRSFVKGKITDCLSGDNLQAIVKFSGSNWSSQGITTTDGIYPSDTSLAGIPVEANVASATMSVTAFVNGGVMSTTSSIATAAKDGVVEKNICLAMPDTSDSKYKMIQIAHLNHVDFSANSMNADSSNQDVFAMGTTYSNRAADASSNYILDLGVVELDSVTSVDTNGWKDATYNPTMTVNHVYVARTLDGYVKFKVLSVSEDMMTGFVVSYQYSATTTF